MPLDKTSDAVNDNPAQISFPGPGPFLLPLCGTAVKVIVAGPLIVLQIETMDGQRLDIPFPVVALPNLAGATSNVAQSVVDES